MNIAPPKPANPNQFTQNPGGGFYSIYGGAGGASQPASTPFHGIGNGVTAASNPYAVYGHGPAAQPGPMTSAFGGPGLNITGSYNLPTNNYLPFPNSAQNQILTNNQVSSIFADADPRNLAKQYGSAPESGVSTDFRHSPGQMANLLAPRAQAASQAAMATASNPYTFDNANFNALMGLQGQQANEAFNLAQLGQNLYQGGQQYNLGQLGNQLGLFQNMFGGLTGAMGNAMNGLMGTGQQPDLSSLLGQGMPTSQLTMPASTPTMGGFNLMPGFTGGFTGGF